MDGDDADQTDVNADAQVEGAEVENEGEAQGAEQADKLPKWATSLIAKVRGQASRSDKKLAQTTEALKAATKKLAQLETAQVGTHKKDAETSLRALRRAALEAQDWDKFEEYDAKLGEVRRAPVHAKEIPVPDVVADDFDDDEKATFSAWQREKSADGEYKRPWAHPDHPKYKKAATIGAAVFSDDDLGLDEKLKEIDRLMAPKGKATHDVATVLSGRDAPSGGKPKTKLSEQDKKLAKLWYGDSAKDDNEAYAKWAEAKANAPKSNYSGAIGNA
jgi:hypothetical protein